MWNAILWGQLGASIDMLENAIAACPGEHWSDSSRRPEWRPKDVVGFWYLPYHTLFFLDLQLSGGSTEGFAPPPPFDLSELDPEGILPERPYTKEEVLAYVTYCRQKARTTIASLSEEAALRVCRHGSFELTFRELLLYGMRHVQHHAGQMNLLLRQNVGAAPRWVKRTACNLC